jgi:hypothetical protein
LLINSSNELKILILKLINLILKTSKLPLSWQESKITVIPKKCTNSSNPKDYKPISLTSCFAKLAGKLISIKLNQYLKKNDPSLPSNNLVLDPIDKQKTIFFIYRKQFLNHSIERKRYETYFLM